jgi:hypothetical protein
MSALRRNASQTEAATNRAAIHKQNQIFTPIVGATHGRGGYLVPRATAGSVRRGSFRGVSGQGEFRDGSFGNYPREFRDREFRGSFGTRSFGQTKLPIMDVHETSGCYRPEIDRAGQLLAVLLELALMGPSRGAPSKFSRQNLVVNLVVRRDWYFEKTELAKDRM